MGGAALSPPARSGRDPLGDGWSEDGRRERRSTHLLIVNNHGKKDAYQTN